MKPPSPNTLALVHALCLASAGLLLSLPLQAITAPSKKRPRRSAVTSDSAFAASHYARLSPSAALSELARRHVPIEPMPSARGVAAPVRLQGPVNGVTWHTGLAATQRARAPWDVFDASLVLALYDFGAILRAHDIDEVLIFSAWRPPPKRWPRSKIGVRHPGAMAVDARRFHKRTTDTWLDVEQDFHGRIGAETCGPAEPAEEPAKELRSLVCGAAQEHLFHSILTPNYNAPHRNHFHLEVCRGVSWFLVH